MKNHWFPCLHLRVCVCAWVCPAHLNGPICCATCSSAASFRLDSISAIPMTFSTKRLQESTRGLTWLARLYTAYAHTLTAQPSVKACFVNRNTHMQRGTEKHACGQSGSLHYVKAGPQREWEKELCVLAANAVARVFIVISAHRIIEYQTVFVPSSLHKVTTTPICPFISTALARS